MTVGISHMLNVPFAFVLQRPHLDGGNHRGVRRDAGLLRPPALLRPAQRNRRSPRDIAQRGDIAQIVSASVQNATRPANFQCSLRV